MRGFMLNRLVTSLLLLATIFATSTVDAFSSASLNHGRSLSSNSHCARHTALFDRKYSNGDANKKFRSSKRKGIIKRDVKKLDWVSRTQFRKNYKNAMKKNGYYGRNGGLRQRIVYRWRGLRQKVREMIHRNTVYVLECENGKYYVGSTKNKKQRYFQHFNGRRGGSKWTRLHKPIRVLAEYNRVPSKYILGMESQKTAEYMMKFGVNNVRGAAFCGAREFTMDDLSELKGFLGHYNQLSYKDLHKELAKILPRSQRTKAYSRPAPRVYKAKKETANTGTVNKPPIKEITLSASTSKITPSSTTELPKAVVRSKLRKSKRRERQKRKAFERKNYKPNGGEKNDDHMDFKNRVDWTMGISEQEE